MTTTRPWAEVLAWLQENVGDLLWSQPIIAWHGDGWHMKSTPIVRQRGLSPTPCYTVKIDNPALAVLFRLWA